MTTLLSCLEWSCASTPSCWTLIGTYGATSVSATSSRKPLLVKWGPPPCLTRCVTLTSASRSLLANQHTHFCNFWREQHLCAGAVTDLCQCCLDQPSMKAKTCLCSHLNTSLQHLCSDTFVKVWVDMVGAASSPHSTGWTQSHACGADTVAVGSRQLAVGCLFSISMRAKVALHRVCNTALLMQRL